MPSEFSTLSEADQDFLRHYEPDIKTPELRPCDDCDKLTPEDELVSCAYRWHWSICADCVVKAANEAAEEAALDAQAAAVHAEVA